MPAHIAARRTTFLIVAVAIAAITATLLYSGAASGDDDSGSYRYEVKITNITKGQILSPAVVATHRSSLKPLFTLGYPASDELAKVAEDAMLDPLINKLKGDSAVADVEVLTGVNGPILPGETASVIIRSTGRAKHISLATMLVTTNDAFAALNGVRLPSWRTDTHRSPAYDAGSEVNNESCDYIPGPPCGNGGVRDTDGAEGYVYIGNGVHGIADLMPDQHDWNNDVAQISIKRVRGGGEDDEDDD